MFLDILTKGRRIILVTFWQLCIKEGCQKSKMTMPQENRGCKLFYASDLQYLSEFLWKQYLKVEEHMMV